MSLVNVIKYYLFWILGITVFVYLGSLILPLRNNFLSQKQEIYLNNFVYSFRGNFDGLHYVSIAENGYKLAQQAFFPLYPHIIKYLTTFTNNSLNSGVIISNVSFILGLYLFSKLLRIDYSEHTTKWIVITSLVYPVSFFFTSVYTESLFFLLLIGSFYSARTNKWLLAGILGGLASYTRLAGIFIFPALIVELIETKNKSLLSWFCVLLIPLGLLTYMNYLYNSFGDPLLFMHVQYLFGQNRSDKIILIYQVMWRYIKMIFTVNKNDFLYLTIILEFISGVVFMIGNVIAYFKVRLSYLVFSILAFIVPTLTGTLTSIPRYVLVCFPVFIIFGLNLSKSRNLIKSLYIISLLIFSLIYITLFSRGYWVS